jgi:hypothetical protein
MIFTPSLPYCSSDICALGAADNQSETRFDRPRLKPISWGSHLHVGHSWSYPRIRRFNKSAGWHAEQPDVTSRIALGASRPVYGKFPGKWTFGRSPLNRGLEIDFGDWPATAYKNSKTAMNESPCWMETVFSFVWVCLPPSPATGLGTRSKSSSPSRLASVSGCDDPLMDSMSSVVERRIPGALTVYERRTPEVFPTGIAAVDLGAGGIPEGSLTQVCAPDGVTSGRTTLLLSLLGQGDRQRASCLRCLLRLRLIDSFGPILAFQKSVVTISLVGSLLHRVATLLAAGQSPAF